MNGLGRILLAEDDPADVDLTLAALEEYNLANEVVVVRDGEEALDYLHRRGSFSSRVKEDPAVLLLDLNMPKVGGLDVLRELRTHERLKLIPAVVLTSSREERDMVAARQLGVSAYLVKAGGFREFVDAIREVGVFWVVINEARFRMFVDHATDAFILHGVDGTVIDVNRQACESLGYGRDELIGMLPPDFDVDSNPARTQRIRRCIESGEVVTFETRHRRKDGSVFPVEVRLRAFRQGGEALQISLHRDITERKRAERRTLAQHAVTRVLTDAATVEEAAPRILQAICEHLGWDLGELWRVEREARTLRRGEIWARESASVLQLAAAGANVFAPGKGLLGRVWGSREPAYITDVAQDPHFQRAELAARDGLHSAFAFPIVIGTEILAVMDFFSREVRPPDPAMLDMMATLGSQIGQFIERIEVQEKLREAQTALARVNRVTTLGVLVASIAHEVNQPLGAMVTSAASCSRWLAAQPPDFDKAQRALERIANDGRRAGEVIDRIRMLVQRRPPRRDRIDVNNAILEVIALTRDETRRYDISLNTSLAPDLPPVAGDRVQLQQVMLNLVVNAIEAMSGLGDRRRELAVCSAENGQALLVEVRDSGPGVDAERAELLFEAFYTTKAEGLGMGLSISRSIIEAHGGRLWASPNEPYGAVFRFSLPAESNRPAARGVMDP